MSRAWPWGDSASTKRPRQPELGSEATVASSLSGGDVMTRALGGATKRAWPAAAKDWCHRTLPCVGNAPNSWLAGGIVPARNSSVPSGGWHHQRHEDFASLSRKRARLGCRAEGEWVDGSDLSPDTNALNIGPQPRGAPCSDVMDCVPVECTTLATIFPSVLPVGTRVVCEWLADGQLAVTCGECTFVLSEPRLRELLELARVKFSGELTTRYFGSTVDQLIAQLDTVVGTRAIGPVAANGMDHLTGVGAAPPAPPATMRSPDPGFPNDGNDRETESSCWYSGQTDLGQVGPNVAFKRDRNFYEGPSTGFRPPGYKRCRII